jgi:glycosyltransferase involved in cell wall biosynthesis
LVLPTQYEAFALTIVEALASGLPVITTAVPGAGDLIEHDVTGLLQQDPADADELADLLRRVLDPAARDRFATAAPRAVAGLEWSTLMARLDDVVQAAR